MNATTPAESSSTEISLRYHAPSCISLAWKAANAYTTDPTDRLWRRFSFVEVALRFIVATLAAEYAARGLSGAPAWEALRTDPTGRPPTLGTWHTLARELSLVVLAAPAPILEGVASVLAQRTPGGVIAGPSNAPVKRLIEVRNSQGHGDPSAGSQAPSLLEATEDDYRSFAGALRVLGKLPVWVARQSSRVGDSFEVEVTSLRGIEEAPPRRLTLLDALEDGRPFTISRTGDCLYLDPLLRWGRFTASGKVARPPELRLFKQWKGGRPTYADPHGFDEPLPLAGAPKQDVDELFRTLGPRSLRRGCITPGGVAGPILLDPDRGEPRPEVPGYELGARLGQGGNGRVYAARDLETQSPVAIKVLSPGLVADPAARDRLAREFSAMTRLTHRNIARVYRHLPDLAHGPTLVMEQVLGENLRAAVARRPLGVHEAVPIIEQVLAALAEAHALGIVHRDVTPENVLVGAAGDVKLIDFGIAIVQGDDRLTRTMDGLGKLNFAAPEQVERPREVGPPADLFAAGRLLGFLVSGSVHEADHLSVLPGALQAIVRLATRPVPNDRYPDAQSMLDALRNARRAGWEGAPVAAGDQLSPDCVVQAVLKRAGDGLWFLEVLDTKQAVLCLGVVAERRQEAEAALDAELRKLSPQLREALGHPDTRTAPGGLHWCRLRVESPAEVGGPFGTPVRSRRAAPPVAEPTTTQPVAQGARPPPPGAPPVLAATRTPPPTPARPATPSASRTPTPGTATTSTSPTSNPPSPPLKPTISSGDSLRTEWRPPGPHETGELELRRGAIPAGILGVVFLFVPLFWPVIVLRLLGAQAAMKIPGPVREPIPSYLPAPTPLRTGTDPAVIARRVDELALIILAQRHARGAQPLALDTLRMLRATPTRPAWMVLSLPAHAELDTHARVAPGPRARLVALQSLRILHEALSPAPRALPPGYGRRLQQLQVLLHRRAHAGARGLKDAEVTIFLARP